MIKPTLYKSTPLESIQTRPTVSLNATEQAEVKAAVAKFFELFAAKHT
jgi:hypothetical protein